MTRFWTSLPWAVAIVALLATCPAPARAAEAGGVEPARPHHLPAVAVSKAVAVQPRGDVKKCLDDLWWSLRDTARDTADITWSCVAEEAQDVKFWWEDVQKFGGEVRDELRATVGKCVQSEYSL